MPMVMDHQNMMLSDCQQPQKLNGQDISIFPSTVRQFLNVEYKQPSLGSYKLTSQKIYSGSVS